MTGLLKALVRPGALGVPNDTAALLAVLHSLNFTVSQFLSCRACRSLHSKILLHRHLLGGVQPPWPGQASWTGEACSGTNYTAWQGVACLNGRVTAVNMSAVGAHGTLDAFGRLTALRVLLLDNNTFYGNGTGLRWSLLYSLSHECIDLYKAISR